MVNNQNACSILTQTVSRCTCSCTNSSIVITSKVCRIPALSAARICCVNRHRLLVLVLLVTVVACLTGLRHVGMQSSTLRRITNTSEEGLNLNPSISGDGRVIGFESTEDVAAAGGADHFRGIRANITGDPATFFQLAGSRLIAPAISQDGSRIAFASRDDLVGANSDGNSEIFLFDGAKLLQITNTSPGSLANRVTNGNFQPSISDDGRFIAFSSNRDLAGQNGDGNLEIFVYDTTASSFAQITNSTGMVGATDAKISGDGTAVAFIRDSGASLSAARDLMKQPRSGGSATTLAANVQSLAMTYGRAISDDGARVVYAAETAANTTQVFMFDGRAGGTIRQITSLGARVSEVPLDPTISGDGSRIAFAARRTVSGAGSNSDGGVELYLYDFPTSTFAKITNAPSSAIAEVVSSLNDDGSIVAFNFPRVLSGAVTNTGTENNSEIYATTPPARPANGTLTAVFNDASFGHEPIATKAIAPNSIAVAQGTNLANTTIQSQRQADGTFPTNVGGTRVTVNGRAAQIFFVSPAQVNFLVPPQTEIGAAEVIVTSAENFPSRANVTASRAAPGIFTKTGDGIGEGLVLNADTLQEGPFDPTGGNLRLSIFTTGARNAAVNAVSLGGRVVNAEAVLPSNTMPGLDEIHLAVPADLRGAGTINVTVNSDGRDSNPVTVNFLGDPGRAIFFNEVLADPPNGLAGDANNDGVRDGTDDEFVELVNGSSAETIALGGWTVKTRATGGTSETTRFTFPAGASIAPGTAAVIFGGGNFNPTDPVFGCAQIFRATSASSGLSLTNTGLTILLRDPAGNLIAQFSYGGSTGLDGNNSQSLTRAPDITGAFVLHTTANAARRFSPGLKVDGTPLGTCAGHPATTSISPTSTSVNQGQSTQFAAQTFDQFGRAMTNAPITFTSDNPTVATIDSTSANQSNMVTANVGTHNPGVAHITASATDGTTTANSSPATLTVVGPTLSVNDVSLNEGNAGPSTFTFTVSLSLPAAAGGVRFDIATQDGTATVANNDYVARALTNQVIPAGAQSFSFDVTVNGDAAIEPNENFFVSVANVSGASIARGQGTATILNDDSPALSVSDLTANEGDSGVTSFTFTVTTPVAASSGGITFDIATADGTGTAASGDYLARALTGQTIPAGQSSYTFEVAVNGDTLVESNETFFVNITNVSGASVNDSQGLGTIQNDDTANLVISQVYPGGGLSNAAYTNDFIELYNRGTTTVDFSITPYSAQFLSTSGSTWVKTDLTTGVIGPGRYFLIREASGGSTGSSLPAADAAGNINLTSTTDGKVALVSGATLLAGSCPGDDGAAPFNPASVADFAGYGGAATTANHCYEGTGPSSFTLGNNTIAAFRKAGGCVDTNDNATDFFTAQPNPRNGSSPAGDCQPEITINDVTVTEGNSGTVNATFTVSLAAASARTVKVDFATADGTATAPSDYQANSGTLTFDPGDLTKTFTVLVNGDTMDEPNQTFFVNLSNALNAVILDSQGQGTINDNDAAPSISINDVAVTEGNSGATAATFTATLSAASGFTVTVNYTTADNTANAGSDYQATSGALTFNPGETSKQISVLVNGDTDFEQNESFFLNLSGAVNATIADSQGIGTINNDDPLPPTPNFFINDVSISEGDSGTNTANFTVTLNPAANQTVTVQYATANATAAAGSDYQSTSGTLTFNANETSKTVSVTINGDMLVESDETFLVNLSNPSAGTNLGDPQGLGTIQNDDLAGLVISQVYPGGGLSGATYANDFIELYNRANTTVDFSVTPYSIQFLSTGGSTWARTDLTSGTIAPGHYFLIKEASGGAVGAALPAADATGTINLTSTTAGKVALVNNSTLLNGNCPGDDGEQPSNPASAAIADFVGYLGTAATANHCYEGSGPASFTSGSNTTADFRKAGGCLDTNDNANDFFVAQPSPRNSASPAGDCKPEIIINDVTITEGNSGTINATFNVTLAAASGQTVTVDFATADGTAAAQADYQANNGTLTFNPGETTKSITVLVNGDTIDEPSETFFVNLSNPVNASLVDGQGLGTINDNDPQPALAINDVSVAEGNSGPAAMTFTVTLSTASGQTVTVNYATADNTAVAPSDYQSASGALTFSPGETAKQITVSVNGDPDFEPNETLFVNLSGATNASISDSQGIGTITNDDAAPPTPTFSINDVSVSEGDSGTTTATFTVTLTPASNQQTTVDYATANGTANSSSDYQTTSGTLIFATGETSKQISVNLSGDTLVEPDETFFLNLTNATGGAAIGDNQGLGTITNDDVAQVSISQIYGGGNNSGATYKNDYVELFNRGTTTVDLAGWSVQQAAATGSSWSVTALCSSGSCLLTPGKYFLVKEAPASPTNGADLPAADANGTANLGTASGKIALVSNAGALSGSGCPFGASIIDFVGYGTTDCSENSTHAPAHNNTTADFRKAGGCTDTNDNAADFFTSVPFPRNSSSATNNCAGGAMPNLSINDVTITEGNSGTTTATFTVSLSAPAQGADVTFDIATANGTATTANSDYVAKSSTNQIIPAGQTTYTFTVNVNGDPNVEPDETFLVNVTNVSGATVTDGQGQGTIQNDDLPSLSINDVSAFEGDASTKTFSFTVSLSAPAPSTVTFDIATADGTATTADNDYLAKSLSGQTIAAGQQTYQFDVTVNGDAAIETNENFVVNVTNVSGATLADGQGTGTIQNDDSPKLTIDDVSANEGDSGTTTFNFTVSLSQPAPAGGVTFDIATADGTATSAANDYVARALTNQSISAGQSSYTFGVTVNGDKLVESNETFLVNVTNVSGAVVLDSQGQGAIQNDDVADLKISQVYGGGNNSGATFQNDFVEIFNHGSTTVDFSITPYSVQYAGVGSNFGSNKTNLTTGSIAPGKYFLVQESGGATNGAPLPTPDATGSITLAGTTGKVALVAGTTALSANACPGDDTVAPFNPGDATVADFVGYGSSPATTGHCYEGPGPAAAPSNTTSDFRKAGGCTDTNDNGADFFTATPAPRNSSSPANSCSGGATPNLTINDVTVTEGNSGTTTATFTVTLSAPPQGTDVTFDIATADGTATTANNDYLAKSLSSQIIPAGQTTYTFTVVVNGDVNVEPDETFLVNVTNVAGAAVTDGQGQGTIQHDDLPSLSINDVAGAEGDSGATTFTFHVTLSDPAPATVSFDIATADGTAQDHNPSSEDNDYQARSIVAQTIAQGASSFDFVVTINGDTTNEPGETFLVNVTNVSGATISDGQGLGTIQNDDAPPDLSITDVTQAEGNAGTTTFNFAVNLSAPAKPGGVSFTINTADGSATAGSDYVAIVNGSGNIAEGNSSTNVAITVNGDVLFEPNETFLVNLSSVTGANVTDGQGLGTINNDDAQPSLSIADASITEGNSGTSAMTFTVTMTGTSQSSVTVNYATTDSSATVADNDYDSASGTLTFASGDTSKTFNVTIHGDANAEGDELFLVDLSSPSGAIISDSQAFGTIFLDDPFSIAAVNTAYNENFDGLAQTGNSSTTPTAWTRAEGGSAANTIYTANNGGSTTGDTYSYGATGSSDRAMGGLRTGTLAPTIGAYFRNDTAATLNSLQIAYTGEEWRLGTAGRAIPDRLDFQYSTNATSLTTGTWTDVDALDFSTPVNTTVGSKDGNNAANRTAISNTINGLSIAPGATFWIRWNDFDATGADDGLAVDDFSITAGVNTPALTIDDLTQSEGNSGPTTFNFNVHLSSPAPPGGVTFTVDTADGTTNPANAGSDYVAILNGSGSIPVNQTCTTVSVTVNGDLTVEPDETFFVNISNVSGATVSDGQALGTISNDDAAATSADLSLTNNVDLSTPNIGENVKFTIKLSNAGPDSASSVQVKDLLPSGLQYVSSTVTQGSYANGTGIWTVGTVTNGADVATLTVTATVLTIGGKTNNAEVTADATTDPDSTPNDGAGDDFASVNVTGAANLLINEVHTQAQASPPADANDFIELFNKGSHPIDINGMVFSFRAGSTSPSTFTVTSSTIIPAGQYLIIVNGATAYGVPADINASSSGFNLTATSGGVKIVLNGVQLDGLAYQTPGNPASTTFLAFEEGNAFTSPTASGQQDYVRSPNGADSGDNATDWRRSGTNSTTVTPKGSNPTITP